MLEKTAMANNVIPTTDPNFQSCCSVLELCSKVKGHDCDSCSDIKQCRAGLDRLIDQCHGQDLEAIPAWQFVQNFVYLKSLDRDLFSL